MNLDRIHTRRLELVLPTIDEVRASIESMSPAEKEHVSDDWLDLVRKASSSDPWIHGFAISTRDHGFVVGRCGFKGPPDSDGTVEIAYAIDPDHQGRGYATEAAKTLVAFAFGNGGVRAVYAHTLPQTNASTRVLTKCGFQRVGEVMDPDDGLVWRWQKKRVSPA
ncbi:MAG: GNAT family N-acetyltransferase [Verrucomicrobiota bacterium]